ncbi:MAG: tRNA pseudouridine(38-40) synthase TruA [Ruminococcaceae bacterium]|nr:tRNA pseudouridine(38-40) synthase TruA [Oscillospiraceae bacterium]
MTELENKASGEKIALTIMYDGTFFHGWQVQNNAKSVQGTLQDGLESVLGFRPDVSGVSRTDSGVHANNYVCHILKDGITIPPERLAAALNSHLRDSGIAVKKAEIKDADFHARYSCVGKEYIYKIWNARYANPFYKDKAMFYPMEIDIEKMRFAEKEFVGTHDFRSFMTKGSKNEENTVRTVKYFNVKKEDELITISVCADGFLYNMVRIMVGTYIDLSRKGASEGAVREIIEKCDRKYAGDTAPAEGLYLNKIFY